MKNLLNFYHYFDKFNKMCLQKHCGNGIMNKTNENGRAIYGNFNNPANNDGCFGVSRIRGILFRGPSCLKSGR
jgi:hypothetical protein